MSCHGNGNGMLYYYRYKQNVLSFAGVTWLLSSKVVQMVETTWLEQLQAFSQQVATVGRQVAAEHGRLADWFLHQQGLFALGRRPWPYAHPAVVEGFPGVTLAR